MAHPELELESLEYAALLISVAAGMFASLIRHHYRDRANMLRRDRVTFLALLVVSALGFLYLVTSCMNRLFG